MAFNFFKKKSNTTSGKDVVHGVSQALMEEVKPEAVKAEIMHELSVQEDNVQPAATMENLSVSLPKLTKSSATVTKPSWAQRLKSGLSKTRDNFSKKLAGVFGGGKIDEDLYEELETILLSSDIGIPATHELLGKIRNKVRLKDLKDGAQLKLALQESITELLLPIEKPLQVEGHKPFVIMLVGVNGAGKTTSIGKLAKYYQDQGKSILLAAGDTFRAAAREQLIEWGSRNNVTVISQASGDSAAVCFDAIQSAIANKIDIVIADTAGRLPTQLNLMEEIKKVKRVIGKALDGAPHEVLLVLDSNIGQNALNQVKAFDDALKLGGLILTKLDGTAKGGIICAIARERPIPLRFIGVGETIDDLRPFLATDYAQAIFE
jgi:fused signal recognition particle receptor